MSPAQKSKLAATCALAVLTILFSLAACERHREANSTMAGTGASAKEQPVSQDAGDDSLTAIRPDLVIAIVGAMEGFLDDCGCAGDSVGGLSRIVSAMHQARGDDVHLVFSGESAPREGDKADFYNQLRKMRTNTAIPFYWVEGDDAGNVRLQPESDSRILLDRLSTLGISLSIGKDRRVAIGTSRGGTLCSAGDLKSRGREICFVGVWNAKASGVLETSMTLGPLYAAAIKGGPKAEISVQDHLNERFDRCVVSKWTVSVSRSFEPNAGVAQLVDEMNVHLFHSGAIEVPVFPQIAAARGKLAAKLCGGCHEHQVAIWEASSHSHALTTLMPKRKQSDTRCLSCHVTSAPLKPSGNLLGVFCNACHTSSEIGGTATAWKASKAHCVTCHTAVTDPESKWKARFSAVCAPDTGKGGDCARAQLPTLRREGD